MSFLKILGIFLVILVIWYFTGGPMRSINLKPYLKFNNETAIIEESDEELKDGLVGQVIDPVQSLNNINESFKLIGK